MLSAPVRSRLLATATSCSCSSSSSSSSSNHLARSAFYDYIAAKTSEKYYSTTTAAAAAAETTSGPSSSSDTSVENAAEEARQDLLKAALPFIPQHGFTIKALQEAIPSLPSTSRFPSSVSSSSSFLSSTASPMLLEQLFPSTTSSRSALHRRQHSFNPRKIIESRNIFKSAESPIPLDDVDAIASEEAIGARKALFEAWAENRLMQLTEDGHAILKQTKDGKADTLTVLQLLEKRLEYNIPVIQHLKPALATLTTADTSSIALPTFRPYFTYAGAVADRIKQITQKNISRPRLATVYSLSEFYQLSQGHPDLESVLDYAHDLLESTRKYDGLIKDGYQFAEYAFTSWASIFRARGM